MSNEVEKPRPRPFQFGIGTILVITTLGAVIVAAGRLMDAPVVMQIGMCTYFFVLLLYIVFRVPYLLRAAFGKDSQWERVKAKRKELEAMGERSREVNQESTTHESE